MEDTATGQCVNEIDRFTPADSEENIDTLNQAAAAERVTPTPTPPPLGQNACSLWAPVRRLICRGMAKHAARSRSHSRFQRIQDEPKSSSFPACQLCKVDHPVNDEIRSPSREELNPNRRASMDYPPPSQLSGMCSPVIPACLRKSCPRPPRRKLKRRFRADDCALQLSSSPAAPRRRRGRRKVARKPRKKRKPPWMKNYRVAPDIWEFLKNYRKDNPRQQLDDMLQRSMCQYAATTIISDSEDDKCGDSDGTEGTFRDAASIALEMSCESDNSSVPSINSLTSPFRLPPAPPPSLITQMSRVCNETCKSPNSVCSKSINSAKNLRRRRVQTECSLSNKCGGGFTAIGPNTRCTRNLLRGGAPAAACSTPIRDNNCQPSSSGSSSCQVRGGQEKPLPCRNGCNTNAKRDAADTKAAAAFQHFMRIYRAQNPNMSMGEAIQRAECAWDPLNPKYKRLYEGAARVYAPTHLSPSPPAAAVDGECEDGECHPRGAPGAGKTLLCALTKKLVDSCKDQLISPEHRRLLRGLIGTRVEVKICDVKKFR